MRPHIGALDPIQTAVRIEEALYNEVTRTSGGFAGDVKHKQKLKMLVANLNSAANPGLAIQILTGKIAPTTFVIMTPREMQSDEMKKLQQEAMENERAAANSSFLRINPVTISSEGSPCGSNCGAKETCCKPAAHEIHAPVATI